MRLLSNYLNINQQQSLLTEIRKVIEQAPLFKPVMPYSGKPFSIEITNCGSLGWLADKKGYRYTFVQPVTNSVWPEMPKSILDLWFETTKVSYAPESCLINYYKSTSKLGMHQDKDEQFKDAPIMSISLGDTAVFKVGNNTPTQLMKLNSGDVLILEGPSRHWYHGINCLMTKTSNLLPEGGRFNLTVRRVTNER